MNLSPSSTDDALVDAVPADACRSRQNRWSAELRDDVNKILLSWSLLAVHVVQVLVVVVRWITATHFPSPAQNRERIVSTR
jgi:hypothetical protein